MNYNKIFQKFLKKSQLDVIFVKNMTNNEFLELHYYL